jgi:hypothetical protein
MGSSRVLAGTRHRWRRGCWPRRRVPQQSAPACPGHPRKQMSGACFRRWGSGRGRNPAGKHVPYRDGDLELAGAPGLSAPAPSAALSWLRYPLCSRSPPDANTGRSRRPGRECPQKTADVRYCLPQTIRLEKYDRSHMTKGGGPDPQCHRQSAGGAEAGNSGCHTSPAPWIAWDEQSGEPSGCNRGGGKGRQRDRQAKRRRLPG